MFNAVAAETECEALETSDAEIEVDEEMIEIQTGDNFGSSSYVEVGEQGELLALCGSQFVEVFGPESGPLNEVGYQEDLESDVLDEDIDLEKGLENADEIEENLDEVNQMLEEEMPDRLRSLVLGDRVNFGVGDTVLGIKSNESEVTGVEEGGVENPTLEISMEEETIENIMTSNDSMQEFREAYHGEGIDVEAHSLRNKIIFGVITVVSTAYGFLSGLF